jgi:hypothetical protein
LARRTAQSRLEPERTWWEAERAKPYLPVKSILAASIFWQYGTFMALAHLADFENG